MLKKILTIGIVCLFFFGGIIFINSSEVKGESVTVMSATLPTGRSYTSAIWNGDHAYIFGGHSVGTEYDQILKYNTSSDSITVMGASLPTPRDGTSAIWNGTHVFIFGGANGASGNPSVPTGVRYDTILRYDPKTDNIITMLATLPREIFFTSAIWDGNNAYIFGGKYDDGGTYKMSDEIVRYNPSSDVVSIMSAKLPEPRTSFSAFWDGNYAYIFPGSGPPNQILKYDPQLDNITTMSANLPPSSLGQKLGHTSTIWDGSNAYIFGGINDTSRFFYEIFRYNPSSDNITLMSASLPSARHGTSSIWDGENAYIFGGYTGGYLNQIVQYEPPEPPLDSFPPPPPLDIEVTPDTWTNINSFTINWTNPYDESGIKTGCWYKIGSPPINNSDGTWIGNKSFTVSSSEGIRTIYVWLEDNLGNVNYTNYNTTKLYLDTTLIATMDVIVYPNYWTNNNSFNISWSVAGFESELSGIKNGTWYKIGNPPTSNYDGIWEENSSFTVSINEDYQRIFLWLEDNAGNTNIWHYLYEVWLLLDTTAPDAPINATADPAIWTNINSFIIQWGEPEDNSGLKFGLWYKIGSPPTSNSDGIWHNNFDLTINSSEGIQTIYIWLEDNLGNVNYLNYSSASMYLDSVPPIINHTSSTDEIFGELITINATITDNIDVNSATLYYRKSDDPVWSSVFMTNINDNYTAEIPVSFVTMAGLYYYIEASDNVHTVKYPEGDSPNSVFNIKIHDGTPPYISHTPVSNGTEGQLITISATIIDNVDVIGATLYYRIKGTTKWNSIPMSQTLNVFSADLPASAVTSNNVEYYILATDSTFNSTHPDTNPQTAPHEITITPEDGHPESKDEKVDFLTSFWWLLLLFFIVVILIVFLLSRRREEEVGIGSQLEEEVQPEEPGELVDQEHPETDLLEEEPEPAKAREDLGTAPKPVPPLLKQDMADDEIFESIKKKFEEGKISERTFEDFKKRYKRE